MNILHIAPHYGGGVESVITNWITNDKENKHTLVSLGFASPILQKKCHKNNVTICQDFSDRNYSFIIETIPSYDIVIIHYWNHPLLFDFLLNAKLPECRIITWCHISGFHAPYLIIDKIIEYSDKFVFTSSISYDALSAKQLSLYENKLSTIWSTSGNKYGKTVKKEQKEFNILYAGSIDFAKLREDFIYICSSLLKEIPDCTITICGDGCDLEFLKRQAEYLNLHNKIIFTGLVSDLTPYFEIADVFLYPLTPTHYGTGEQILGEAMSAGIVPVVFDNKAEKRIVEDELTGFIVSSIEQCINRIKELYEDKEDGLNWSQLSLNAKLSAQEKYSTKRMINDWNMLFSKIILYDKKEREWKKDIIELTNEGIILFLESLGEYKENFLNYILNKQILQDLFSFNNQWYSKSKGSIYHYLEYFPDDKYLNDFKKIMEE
jgi:L-malate glycosyltransferase